MTASVSSSLEPAFDRPADLAVSGRQLAVSPGWFLLAVASIVALAIAAPGGLYLLGFLGLVVFLHEAGHFVVARWAGMAPTQFYWGFGPEVVGVQVGRCRVGVRALFLGGYVRLEGMTPSSSLPDGFAESGTFRAAPVSGRLATLLAGPGINLVSGVVAFTVHGLIDGRGPVAAVWAAFDQVWAVVEATAVALWTLFSNLGTYVAAVIDPSGATEAPVRFLSPVAQAQNSELAIELGPTTALLWFGILSTAIGITNLFPLPPLDGGHTVVAIAEWGVGRVRGRPVRFDASRLNPLAWCTVAILAMLTISALVLDIRDLG